MEWQITYYSEDVREILESWPVGIRAYYARLTERIKVYGPNLGMPFTRAIENGIFADYIGFWGGLRYNQAYYYNGFDA